MARNNRIAYSPIQHIVESVYLNRASEVMRSRSWTISPTFRTICITRSIRRSEDVFGILRLPYGGTDPA
jgi:hypothetical protein